MFKQWSRLKSGKAAFPSSIGSKSDMKLYYDTVQFLNIFPELVWKNIIKQLDLNDLQILSNSSPFFRNLLLQERIKFLFKDLFEIVALSLLEKVQPNRFVESSGWSLRKKDQATILNCRLVCRAWSKSISDIAQEVASDWNWKSGKRDKIAVFKFITKAYEFTFTDKINMFLNKFQGSFENPFFGNTIFLSLPRVYVLQNPVEHLFYENILVLLNLFGKYVINCRIYSSSTSFVANVEPQQAYLYFMDILWAMPNLRNLRIISFKCITANQIKNIREPPTLEKLKILSIFDVCGPVCNIIVTNNLHVSTLVIEQLGHIMENTGFLVHSFENLQHLKLIWCHWNEIGRLRHFDLTYWNLKSLELVYHAAVDGKPKWWEVLNILSTKFGKNLEQLIFIFPELILKQEEKQNIKEMLEYRLSLPKLTELNLTVQNDVTFDFLLGLSESLESLRITSFARQRGKESENYAAAKRCETIELLSCYDKLYESNIWEKLPKLKSVELCFKFKFCWSYNRHDWRKRKQKLQLYRNSKF